MQLQGSARKADGDAQRKIAVRAKVDITTRIDTISPSLACGLGFKVARSEYTAGEAVGEWELGGEVNVEIVFPGVRPSSGLSQEFRTARHFTIARVQESDVDIVLGMSFLRDFQANFGFNEPYEIQLTTKDGNMTAIKTITDDYDDLE